MTKTVLLILAAMALMIGTFIWFVATWDADAEKSITFDTPLQRGATA